VLPNHLKTCFVRKRTPAFSPSEPRETSSNNSGFTSSQLTWKWTQLMLWKVPPITKEAGQWTTIWTTSRPWSPTQVTDPRTLVVKFQRGLRLGIQNQIATMPYGRPADTDPDAWYRAARRIDQACLANEAFQSVSRSTPSAPPKTVSAQPSPLSVARLPPVLLLPVTPKPPPPAPSMGIPMDVDTTRKTRSLPPRGCYRCGDANHLVRDCPHCMDVR